MLLQKIKKFKTVKLISEFAFILFLIAFLLFFLLIILVKIPAMTNGIGLRTIFSVFFLLISSFGFVTIISYISKLKILNFDKYFNKEEVMNNFSLFNFNQPDLKSELLIFFETNTDLIQGNIMIVTEKLHNKDWIVNINLDTEHRKLLLLDKDLDWYSRQVSTRELYLYLQKEINECVDNNQSEYYTSINNIFSDFIPPEQLQKMKNTINVDQKNLIINI